MAFASLKETIKSWFVSEPLGIEHGGTGSNSVDVVSKIEELESAWDSVSQMSDFPVAQGTSDVWEYVKFASGLAICACKYTGTHSHYAGQYANWLYGYYGDISYPFTFTSVPRGAYVVQVGSGFSMPASSFYGFDNGSASNFRWYALGNVSGSQTVRVDAVVIGRWK